jgi:hypothetical protein
LKKYHHRNDVLFPPLNIRAIPFGLLSLDPRADYRCREYAALKVVTEQDVVNRVKKERKREARRLKEYSLALFLHPIDDVLLRHNFQSRILPTRYVRKYN